MPEIFDERRQEPRFATQGEASFMFADRNHVATLLDLSLNGMRVSRPGDFTPPKGEHFRITLEVPGSDRFTAEVLLVHTEDKELGLEFYDMPARDFGVLAGLIEQFAKVRRSDCNLF